MKREIQVLGDSADLEILSRTFESDAIAIAKNGDDWVLRARELDDLPDYGAVRVRAKEILTSLSGAARLLIGSESPLAAGTITEYQDGKSVNKIVEIQPAVGRSRAFPISVIIGRPDGSSEVHHPADRARNWLTMASRDSAIARALRLRNQEELDWVDLYRLFEVVESEVPIREIVVRGWASEADIRLFKHTANSLTATGDGARHGKETSDPPSAPMQLSSARSFVDVLLQKWLDAKSGPTAT